MRNGFLVGLFILATSLVSTRAFSQSGCTPAPTPTAVPTPTATSTPTPTGPLTVISPSSGGVVTCQMLVSVAMKPPGYITYFYIDNVYQYISLEGTQEQSSVTYQPLPLSQMGDGRHTLSFVTTDGQNDIVAESAETVMFDLAAWRALPHNACTSSSPTETCTDGCITGSSIVTPTPVSPTPTSTPTPSTPNCSTVFGFPGIVCGTPIYCGDPGAPSGISGRTICPSGAQLWGGACILSQTPGTAIYVPPGSC